MSMRHRSLLCLAAAVSFTAIHGCGSDSNGDPNGSSSGVPETDGGEGGTNPEVRTLPSFNGPVRATVTLGDALFVGGGFTAVNSRPAQNALALSLTGAPSGPCTVADAFDGPVTGFGTTTTSLYAVGEFTHVGGQPANHIAKVDLATCALDTTFSPSAQNGFDANARALIVTDTALYVGGDFTAYRGVVNSANRLAKLDAATGAIDPAFNPAGAATNGFASGYVASLFLANDRLYVGGSFSSYRGGANNARNLAKVETTNGILDATFTLPSSGFNQAVNTVFAGASGIFVGGGFSTYRGSTANYVVKLDPTSGAVDTTFTPNEINGTNGEVHAVALAGGALYVGGNFASYRGQAVSNLAKVDPTTGARDAAFSPAMEQGFDGAVRVLLQSDAASIFVGGDFTNYRGAAAGHLAKVSLTTGAVDETFTFGNATFRGFNGSVRTIAPTATTLFVGGAFDAFGGTRARGLVKLNAQSFAIDSTFQSAENDGFDDAVTSLAASSTSVYVGGSFGRYRGVPNSAHFIAKLDPTSGAMDVAFSPPGAGANGFDGDVLTLTANDTAVYAGGAFMSYRGAPGSARGIAKLNATTGELDVVFSPPAGNGFSQAGGGEVRSIALLGDTLFVGGGFTDYRAAPGARNIARLNASTGELDVAFSPAASNGFENTVFALTTSGSSLYVGGAFNSYRGVANSANRVAKLDTTTGALDATFSPPASNGFDGDVNALLAHEGSVYVGGAFTAYRGVSSSALGLAKLSAESGALDAAFTPGGTALFTGGAVHVLAFASPTVCLGGDFVTYRGASMRGFTCVAPETGVAP